jgi:hypothetical protein
MSFNKLAKLDLDQISYIFMQHQHIIYEEYQSLTKKVKHYLSKKAYPLRVFSTLVREAHLSSQFAHLILHIIIHDKDLLK